LSGDGSLLLGPKRVECASFNDEMFGDRRRGGLNRAEPGDVDSKVAPAVGSLLLEERARSAPSEGRAMDSDCPVLVGPGGAQMASVD